MIGEITVAPRPRPGAEAGGAPTSIPSFVQALLDRLTSSRATMFAVAMVPFHRRIADLPQHRRRSTDHAALRVESCITGSQFQLRLHCSTVQ